LREKLKFLADELDNNNNLLLHKNAELNELKAQLAQEKSISKNNERDFQMKIELLEVKI
jgi:hypothetical protein